MKRKTLRCRVGLHKLEEDWDATVHFMQAHGISVMGWPSGDGVLYVCQRCGKIFR